MANAVRVTMPQLGESVHEGTISKWLVKPGDKVVEFEPLFEVETDKGATEVPSPVTGILKEILAADGTTVASGGEIAVVEVEGDSAAPAKAAAPTPAAVAEARPEETPSAQEQAPAAQAPEEQPKAASGVRLESGEHRYSPAVRMLAEQNQLDLESVHGSGLGGRVTKKDVEAAAAGRAAAPGRQAAAAAQPGAQAPVAEAPGDE